LLHCASIGIAQGKKIGGKTVIKKTSVNKFVPAIRVKQWLPEWDSIQFDHSAQQSKPLPHFLLCSIKAKDLKALTGVYRRSTKGKLARAKDPNVQRGHDELRSQIIREFVKFGYPWCEMTESRRASPAAQNLQKPGWLPTAILVNILPESAIRNGQKISSADLVRVAEEGDVALINFPESYIDGATWEPNSVFPLEVIDGQHRLWAFDGYDPGDDYELPVVAFFDLDRSWQAYLFWSVNITPKKINRSLAFDLYPLLRREDWLDQFAGHSIYRETRCQELVEALWSSEASPWHDRINMLGEKKADRESQVPMVTQAAWIRSLMATFVKQWDSGSSKIGGLFGAGKKQDDLLLPWNRPMQAALLIYAGAELKASVKECSLPWAEALRNAVPPTLFLDEDDLAMFGENSLLATDQGIRGFLFIVNDLLFVSEDSLQLKSWTWESVYDGAGAKKYAATEEDAQAMALAALKKTPISNFIREIAKRLAGYDWRTSSTSGLTEEQRKAKLVFRGSSGYKELRKQLLEHLSQQGGQVGIAASDVFSRLGYK
jgi:hypothetical protein